MDGYAAPVNATDFSISQNSAPELVSDAELAKILANPGFGVNFTDHMFRAIWTPEKGWHDAEVTGYAPLVLDPATAVLHYAQEIFEGLKAYRHADGSIWTFRSDANGARLAHSSRRLALPELPVEVFVQSVDALISADQRWVPDPAGEKSLYLRPFMFASERFLGVRPTQHATYLVIASPAGAYFSGGLKPVRLGLSEQFTRAGKGGMGSAKTGGNYASSLAAQQEAIAKGYDQVVFLDDIEGKYVEELGGMNLWFVYDDGTIVTPELGTILEGITRNSIITLATDMGYQVQERRFSIDEWKAGISSGRITEVFACGTAAVVTPVGALAWADGDLTWAETGAGEVTQKIRQALVDIQYGRAEDRHGWMHRVC